MSAAPPKLAGYEHFLAVSRRQAWDAEAIDLMPDRAAWPCLEAGERASVARLVAGFCVGEAAVAVVLEGVVFAAGQEALLGLLDGTGIGLLLPGLREGAGLVARDERWHIGFGARCLQDVDAPPELVARIAAQGREAADAWRTALAPGLREHARAVHDRRLGAAALDAGAAEPAR